MNASWRLPSPKPITVRKMPDFARASLVASSSSFVMPTLKSPSVARITRFVRRP